MKIDLKNFKKVDANRDHTVFQHNTDGHLIYVKNASISKDYHEALRQLPLQKLSKGGPVRRPEGPDGKPIKLDPTKTQAWNNAMAAAGFKKMNDGGIVKMSGEGIKSPEEQIVKAPSTPAPLPPGFEEPVVFDDSKLTPEQLAASGATPQTLSPFTLQNLGSAAQGLGSAAKGLLKPFPGISSKGNTPAPEAAPLTEEPVTNYDLTPAEPAQERGLATPPPSMPETSLAEQALDDFKAGAQDEAKALEGETKEKLAVLENQLKQQQEIDVISQNNLKDMVAFYNTAKATPPQTIWEGKTALGKIMTGIGLFLGGAPVANFLYKQIDDQARAQDAQFEANLKKFGNIQDAVAARRIQLNASTEMLLQQAMLKTADPIKQARLRQEIAVVQQRSATDIEKLKQERTARQWQERQMMGLSKDVDPYRQELRMLEAVDPKAAAEKRERLTPYGFADTKDDAKEIKELAATSETARGSVKRLKQIGETPGSSVSFKLREEAQSLVTTLVASLNKPITGGGPMTETERALITALAKNPTAIFSLGVKNKASLNALERFIDRREADALKARGLAPKRRASGPTPQGMKK